MRTPRRSAPAVLSAAVLLAAGLTGCAGSGHPSSATGSAPKPAPATRASTLSKADFITRTDKVCAATDARRKALPDPSTSQNAADLISYIDGILVLVPSYLAAVQPLVAQSPDAAELNAKWLDLEKGDYRTFAPLAQKEVDDLKAGNTALLPGDEKAIAAAQDHSSQMAAFLQSYGLTDCAALENG
jgi:hypothetical protein